MMYAESDPQAQIRVKALEEVLQTLGWTKGGTLRIDYRWVGTDVVGMRIVLEASHGFPAVNDRHFEVHQNYVRVLGYSQLAALLAVASRENLETAKQLKACPEHVNVVVVVFDVEHFGHETDFIPLVTYLAGNSVPSSGRTCSSLTFVSYAVELSGHCAPPTLLARN